MILEYIWLWFQFQQKDQFFPACTQCWKDTSPPLFCVFRGVLLCLRKFWILGIWTTSFRLLQFVEFNAISYNINAGKVQLSCKLRIYICLKISGPSSKTPFFSYLCRCNLIFSPEESLPVLLGGDCPPCVNCSMKIASETCCNNCICVDDKHVYILQ